MCKLCYVLSVPEEEEDEEEEDTVVENGVDDEDVDTDVSKARTAADPAKEPLPVLSNAELFALRRRKLAEKKENIAVCVFAVLESPEENVMYYCSVTDTNFTLNVPVFQILKYHCSFIFSEIFQK